MNTLQNGFWSGVLATAPMTSMMMALAKSNPEQKPLPPALLTEDLTAPIADSLSSNRRADLSMVSHFGFGVALGSVYALSRMRRSSTSVQSDVLKGAAFGSFVWASSYLGWIPALGMRPSAKNSSAARNAMMIGAHLVWGAVLGFSESEFRKRGNWLLDGAISKRSGIPERPTSPANASYKSKRSRRKQPKGRR